VNHYLVTGELLPEPTVRDKIRMACHHAQLMAEEFGEQRGIVKMRRYLGWYVKGFPGASELRPQLFRVNALADIYRVFEYYFS